MTKNQNPFERWSKKERLSGQPRPPVIHHGWSTTTPVEDMPPWERRQENTPPEPKQPRRRFKIPQNWQFWSIIAVFIFGGVGVFATALLLKLPAVPNCPAIFWPMASASMRIYCAQLAANKRTAEDLLEAIALVANLPKDHPMREEIDRHLEEWSVEILKICEKKFQEGNIKSAIATAKEIPNHVKAYGLVDEQIKRWQSIWEEAEGIYNEAQKELQNSDWSKALRTAVKLTRLDNKYWSTKKYEELVEEIQFAQEESSRLDEAYAALQRGGFDNYIKAIEMAQKIRSSSPAYQEAQKLINEAGNKLVKSAKGRIEKRDWQGLLRIANAIPPSLKLEKQVRDWTNLANAGISADAGTIAGLENAIIAAQKIRPGSPLYDNTQDIISRWQLEIEDVSRLDRAKGLASSGRISDLSAAIAEVQLIPRGNPRYSRAQELIDTWSGQIKVAEARPYLDRSEQLAQYGDINSLERAIDEASAISANNPLYNEAQQKIGEWRRRIQRQEDQPYLDQAVTLANAGNLPAAIEAAQTIRPGRALYGEAQGKIKEWRSEIQGRQRLQEAFSIANSGTPDALVRAISVARQIPAGTSASSQGSQAVGRWSYQILAVARSQAEGGNYDNGIRVARQVPSGTEAYGEARRQIETWQRLLEPPAQTLEPIPTVQ